MSIVTYGYGLSPGTGTGGLSPLPIVTGQLVNNFMTQRIQQILYQLKLLYGNTIDIYQVGDATVDYNTGVASVPKTKTRVRRAIVMPVKTAQKAIQTIAVISANKQFVRGGTFEKNTRVFIIDRKDVPGLDMTESDYIVYRDKKYEIEALESYEFDSAWVVIGNAVDGDKFTELHNNLTDDLLVFTEVVTGVIV
jgi:hypothetical protein